MSIEATKSLKTGVWLDLATSDYAEMARVQNILRQKRQQEVIPDVVILLEHSPCITIGSSGGYQNLLADTDVLDAYGITVHDTSRGGNITYHGPGQLVCYPIVSLEGERDLHAYARKMEEVMIRTLSSFGIVAERKPEFPGVWVQNAKIGAMGIAVRKWVTMHGIALNVCPDLTHFSLIVPCGIASNGVTSMEEVLGHSVDPNMVRIEMRKHFSRIFQMSFRSGKLEQFIEEDSIETT
ncbi:lipoyl(octanoyl) transferase LipB [Desulfogranum japonicum]|uniref:lipoyl(octanoyl) transferase LipB n=1 Tax=Desulfogranum japonicum TaxID=231447 RepID=UPI0003F73392|nr:lipoyl(octanoyl) transferase LipB [Desulfogranum japonicum]